MNSHGEQTEDLRSRNTDAVAATEAQAERFGRRCFTWGLILAPGAIVASLTAAILSGGGLWTNNDGQLFAVLGLVSVFSTSGALILVGAFERLQRPVRARQKIGAQQIDTNRILVERLTVDVQELAGIVATIPDRLAALEGVVDRVPAYGEGVIQGITLGQSSVGPEQN